MAAPAHVLIVDDHPLFVEALQRAIVSAFPGTKTSEAVSIEAAKSVLDGRTPFDIVLLDLALPGTRGFEGLLELRTLHPKLPIVVVSALEDPRIVQDVMRYGAAGFISKSADRAEIAAALKDVMEGSLTLPKGYRPPELPQASQAHGDLVAAAEDVDAEAVERAAHAAPGPPQQADRARAADRGDDGQGPRLGNSAQAQRVVAHAGGHRGAEDRFARSV